ncbi:MAG: hypothetical protein JNL25_06375 [Rhodospirillaceae bacterium]|nr:hypothetical protein [Rhodospirillaceae bacterium]
MLKLRPALKPDGLGYLAAIGIYVFVYRRILSNTFAEAAPLFILVMLATVVVWYVVIAGRGNRALFLWAGCAPLLGASVGYLAISLLFLAQHGQFIGGFGLGQWLPNALVMATFMARAWALSFLLIVWATVLYVFRPAS